jgi:probable O-glycosylation ligase (exosortase A-associated)
MLMVLWWRGKNKFATGLIMVVAGAAALSFMPPEWWARMDTIQTHEDNSAQGRINAWMMAFNIAKANFFGGGFSIYNPFVYRIYAPNPAHIVSAHSIYFHMLGEHGFVGLFIFLCLWMSTWLSAGWLRKHGRKQAETEWCVQLGSMIQVALVGYAVGGAFLSLSYFDLPYNLMALTTAACAWVKIRGWEKEPAFQPQKRIFGIPLFFGDQLRLRSGSTPERA